MTKDEALKLIDDHKNALLNPVEMLHWTALRVIILKIDDKAWEAALGEAVQVMSN
jgi:hypothetical protein